MGRKGRRNAQQCGRFLPISAFAADCGLVAFILGYLFRPSLTLYTAIGHTLWHENDKKVFKKHFESYKTLFNKLTDGCDLRTEMHAFLVAMEGRKAYLEKQGVEKVMGHFDSALNIMGPEKRRTRGGLHIINYYLDHLNEMYASAEFEKAYSVLHEKMELLFLEFNNCRNGTPKRKDDSIEPIKTLLQIHFGVHRLRKMYRDQQLKLGGSSDLDAKIEATSRDLMFTAAMLGLGSLNPCPPLLRDVYEYAGKQRGMFDLNQAKEQLKGHLRDLHPEEFETIAEIYFKHLGFEVDRLPGRAPTFDLLVNVDDRLGRNSLTGVQVKRLRDKWSSAKFDEWTGIAQRVFKQRNKITHVIFFMTSNPDSSIKCGKKVSRITFPHIQTNIEFWNIDEIAERLWRQSGCLPRVYAVIENSVRAKHLNEPASE